MTAPTKTFATSTVPIPRHLLLRPVRWVIPTAVPQQNPEVRPLDAKPVEETPKSNRKAKSKPAADPVIPGKSAAASKRPAEDTASKDAKKTKKSPAAELETAEKKSNVFQRLWSEGDEIVILEGMIAFQNKFKVDPLANLGDEGRRSTVRCAFDLGGDVSQQFLAFNSRRVSWSPP